MDPVPPPSEPGTSPGLTEDPAPDAPPSEGPTTDADGPTTDAEAAEPEEDRNANGAAETPDASTRLRRGWPVAAPPGGIRWTRMLFIGVICFAVWLLLDAPSLQRSAEISPLGARRTVSLDTVGPIAALSRGLGLSHVVGWADEVLGRTPGGGPTLAVRISPVRPTRDAHHAAGPRPAAPSTPPTTVLAALDQHPTAAAPLRVLVVGDSIGIDLGQPLVADLSATGVVSASLDGRIDTGLSRPDYFNWPAELGIDLANQR